MRNLVAFALLLSSYSSAREPQPRAGMPIPTAESVAAMVPASGPLGERELTLLAIARRPELEALRGAVAIAAAAKLAAHDLPNPELRLSYAQSDDTRLAQPYTEHETSSLSRQENFDSLTTSSSLSQPGQTSVEREIATTQTNREREIERRVTPGATKDRVEERTYETRTSSTSGNRTETKSSGTGNSDAQIGTENRQLIGVSRTEIQHPDARGRDNAFGALLRFQLPHPWERKARIQRAAAEITLAESNYYAEEDKVVRSVRAAFQQLAMLRAQLSSQSRRKAANESYRDWLDDQKAPQLGLELASARAKVYDTLTNIRSLEASVAATRDELAAYCGLADASRINATLTTRRVAAPGSLDVDYLTSLALLYRSDVLGSQARLAVARAQLAETKATRIPFATFFDVGGSQVETLDRSGKKSEWFVRVGVSIPIWDWTGYNKRHMVHEAATQSWERQIRMQQTIIVTEITQAVKRLKTAEDLLTSREKDLKDLKSDMQKSKDETLLATLDANDVIKSKRIEHEFQDLGQQLELGRYAASSTYSDALMALEKAIGVRIERALSPGAQSKPVAP